MRKKSDKRMEWILIVEESKTPDTRVSYTEYEICSEARIVGVLDYESGALSCWLLQEKNQNGLYTYVLRVKYIEKVYKSDANNYSKKGYYFKDNLIGELMSLFSVYFQARFYLKATVSYFSNCRFCIENVFQYKMPHLFLNYEMFSKQKREWGKREGLILFLNKIRGLDQKYHQNLIRAFYWYAEAIKEIGIDHQLFYIKMVSAVEALLEFSEVTSDSLAKKLLQFIDNEKFLKDEAVEINNWLTNRKISKRFVLFLQKYSSNFFKGGRIKAKICHIYKTQLDENQRPVDQIEKYAKRIYKARSAYLHTGEPMYLSRDSLVEFKKYWDLDGSSGGTADGKKFTEKQKLPRTRWFERLVNHCFKNFIDHLHKKK